MSIGTAIFFSSLIAAFLILFLRTKDQWNWKKIAFRSTIILVGSLVVIGGIIYSYTIWKERPQKQTNFWGINLGDGKRDVVFEKGDASVFAGKKNDPNLWVYALNSDGSTRSTANEGDAARQVYLVRFTSDRVRYVEVIFGDFPSFPNLGGIESFSSLDDIEKILGQPTYVSYSADQKTRYYSFAEYNVAFAFERGKMSAEAIYDSKAGPMKFSEEAK